MARHFSIGRNTVRRVLRKYTDRREHGHDIIRVKQKKVIIRASKLDPFEDQIKALFKDFPKITGQRVFEELRNSGYTGGISILRERLRSLRPLPKRARWFVLKLSPAFKDRWTGVLTLLILPAQVKLRSTAFLIFSGFPGGSTLILHHGEIFSV